MTEALVPTRTLGAPAGTERLVAPPARVSEKSATAITLTWLVRLRWGFFVGQAATVLASRYVLDVDVPVSALAGVVAASGASNLALDVWSRGQRDPSDVALGSIFALDTLLLTALLYFSGGPANPFSEPGHPAT